MSETTWEINITNECRDWFTSLDQPLQDAIYDRVLRLEQDGPSLGRPTVAEVNNLVIHNLKELRVDVRDRGHRRSIRILFLFDPRRQVILLVGGDKASGSAFNAWYAGAIREAERLLGRYLAELREDGLID